MQRLRYVDPGSLRLPPARQDGAVPARYHRQVRQFAASQDGMPPIEVTEGKDAELVINNGVTRATRIHHLAPGDFVPIEVIDVRSKWDLSRYKRVRDVPPP